MSASGTFKSATNREHRHPEISLIFTCLSFYYTGLNNVQLHRTLEILGRGNDPASQYERITYQCKTLPGSLKQWTHLNLEDNAQIEILGQHLRLEVPVIDVFLDQYVFPRYARQFDVKLQLSGWDLTDNTRNSTGFSGTNDTKRLLPLNIIQNDLPALKHTNAEVLSLLLQSRNRSYIVAADSSGGRLHERGLLEKLHANDCTALIDAGAVIVDMDNLSLAKAWLDIDSEAKAAVYFNTRNEATVIHRNRKILPLSSTPFAGNLSDCVVYVSAAI